MFKIAKEKLSDSQKKYIAKLNPSGKEVEYVRGIVGNVKSESTIYKAKREGRLLNYIEEVEKSNRELIVQKKILEESNKALA